MIRKGQIYESCDPRMPIRVKVIGDPVAQYGITGKVHIVTVDPYGRESRPRKIDARYLHATDTAASGFPRRTGYRLIQDAPDD